jgi:hypothetical protein
MIKLEWKMLWRQAKEKLHNLNKLKTINLYFAQITPQLDLYLQF